MNENNRNVNIEKVSESKQAIYSSSVLMDREFFYDFSSVSYCKLKKYFLFLLCFTSFFIIVSIMLKNYGIVIISVAIPMAMFILFLKIKDVIKRNYERTVISAGKEVTLYEEIFEDKIVSQVDAQKREYFYYQITKFLETKEFLLLHLGHQLYITINKDALNASVDEVKSFLIEKCPLVKKKKFIDCSNDRKWTLILLISTVTMSVLGIVIAFVLGFINLF